MVADRLSCDLTAMRERYTVVVVGSGYGAAISACRLARAGQDVCVLERGRELVPGEYPRTSEEAARQLQLEDGSKRVGDPRNLYRFHVGSDINVFSGCGLGGTSLVNANVALRPEQEVLHDRCWPAALRQDRDGLDAAFARAEEMLQPTPYPDHYPPLAKVEQLRRSAAGATFYKTPINVRFTTGPNAVGVWQEACNGCGDCVSGCNYGSKNTLLMNYLPDAVAHGAHVFTEIDVRWVEPGSDTTGGGWTVWYQPLALHRDRFGAPPLSLHADVVVIGAGTLGSNEILLRSRAHGLAVSDRLGERFTGNGDMLGFSYGVHGVVDGIGAGPAAPSPVTPPGPCITSVVDDRENSDHRQDVVIEDAAIPGAIADLVPGMLAGQLLPRWLKMQLPWGTGPIGLIRSALTHGHAGALPRVQTFLLMGIDGDAGRVVLDGDDVRVVWPGAGTRPFYRRANARLARAAHASGGTYLHSPIFDRLLRHEIVTVHPLGGCVMGDSGRDAVVDHKGRVFAGADTTDVHPGLYVSDGSVIPMPLGVNPLLTISALAERTASLIAADHGWTIDLTLPAPRITSLTGHLPDTPPHPRDLPPTRPGIRFSEKMSGGFSLGDGGHETLGLQDLDPYLAAAKAGEEAGSHLTFVLTLSTDDAETILARLDAPMSAAGTVDCPVLSPEPMNVVGGQFQLFVQDDQDHRVRHMWYRLPLETVDGERYAFTGYKVIQPGSGANMWPDTTTLYVTVRRGDEHGPVAGRGVLRIAPEDFARQLGTMTTTGPVGRVERAEILAKFGAHFAGVLARDYGHVLPGSYPFKRNAPPRAHRPLRVPPPTVHAYRSYDGLDLRLTRYEGGTRGPVVLSHGAGTNPLTYTTDLIPTNTVEYLVDNGFDVWVQEWRASTLLPTCFRSFDADVVARFDHPAAEAYIRAATGCHDLHWVNHCIGSMSTLMAATIGTITPASMVASACGLHPIGPTISKLKAGLHVAAILRSIGIRRLTTDSYNDESMDAKLLDLLLRFEPIPLAERCDSAVCRRAAFIYGIPMHHAALNEETHVNMHEFFGPINLRMMQHLSLCVERRRVVDAAGCDRYLARLDLLQFPISFIHGAHNLVWLPVSTELTHDLLVREFGPANYRRTVFPEHGHGDVYMGATAADDVYPVILAHLEWAGA